MPYGPMLAMAGLSGLGGLMSKAGKPNAAQTTQLQRFNPQQQGLMNQAGQMGMQGLQDPTAGYEPMAAQAREQFMSQTMPGLAERFAGLGATNSSGFQGALMGAGESLERGLASDKAQYGLQNQDAMMRLMQMGLTPQYENYHQPETPGVMQQLGSSLMGQGMAGATQMGVGTYLGNQQAQHRSDAITQWQEYEKQRDNPRPMSMLMGSHPMSTLGRM